MARLVSELFWGEQFVSQPRILALFGGAGLASVIVFFLDGAKTPRFYPTDIFYVSLSRAGKGSLLLETVFSGLCKLFVNAEGYQLQVFWGYLEQLRKTVYRNKGIHRADHGIYLVFLQVVKRVPYFHSGDYLHKMEILYNFIFTAVLVVFQMFRKN